MRIIEKQKPDRKYLTIPEMVCGQGFLYGSRRYCVKVADQYGNSVILDLKSNTLFTDYDRSIRYDLVDLDVVVKND